MNHNDKEGPRGISYGKGAVAEHFKDVKRANPEGFRNDRSSAKASAKKKELAGKIGKPAYPQKGKADGDHFFRSERPDREKNSPL